MRLLYIADGRSPTARNWISYFIDARHEVHLISTSACPPLPGLASMRVIPVAFSDAGMQSMGEDIVKGGKVGALRRVAPMSVRTFIRQWLGPLTFPKTIPLLGEWLSSVEPDLIHAMRYPYEGMIAALARPSAPLLVSVWGNDFTLHAASNPLLGYYTRKALRLTSALHLDCQRDLRLARQWGFPADRPAIVLPGAGGIRSELFYPPASPRPDSPPVVINPRGFRTYIRNDTFFKAIPLVLEQIPDACFICPAMQDVPQAQHWLAHYQIGHAVELLPVLPHAQMADLFRQAHIVVSPSTHDGTPNSLLEAVACGCFPVAGDIESLREWIDPGRNGLLVDPADCQALADAILQAIRDTDLRQRAVQANLEMIAEKAEYTTVMAKASAFYQEVLHAH